MSDKSPSSVLRVVPTDLAGVLVIETPAYQDARGYFFEGYHEARYAAHGISERFVQDNHSRSVFGTIRGLHLQVRRPQGKLIRVLQGEIYDVAVDVRRGSPTFGRWVGVTLGADTFRQLYVPAGFAHGFGVLSPVADVVYKCTDYYDPADELGIAWNDPDLGIAWGIEAPILSPRDRAHPGLREVDDRLPTYLTDL